MDEHQHHATPTLVRTCDVAIIGGSAAGLGAALQVARQSRSVIVIDDGSPRNAPAAHMHGYLGHEGAAPSELTAIGREEVRSYGGEVLSGRVLEVVRDGDGRFRVALSGGHALVARRVIAATGLVDVLPDDIEGLAEHWGRDVIHCPFCHGFEVRDRRLVQIVTHPMGLHPTPLLRHLTDRLTVVVHDGTCVDATSLDALAASGITVIRRAARRVATEPAGSVSGLELTDGTTIDADAIVVGPRFAARSEVLSALGLTATPHPTGLGDAVEVDPTGQTSVPGLYAAGNLTDPGMQVLHAAAHGTRVGATVASSLAEEDLRDGRRASGARTDWEHRYAGEDPVWSANPNGSMVVEVGSLPAGRALDIGSGEGADAIWLAERGWRVTASDISANALARVGAEAERRGVAVDLLHRDANALDAYETGAYDLVSLQYGSFHRTPDGRGLRNLIGAVAPGGTLVVVAHDLTPMQQPIDVATQTRMYDPAAYVGIDEIIAALVADPAWTIEVHEARPRPAGAVSTHHVDDVILRARRA